MPGGTEVRNEMAPVMIVGILVETQTDYEPRAWQLHDLARFYIWGIQVSPEEIISYVD
jgi:hypothetical protein